MSLNIAAITAALRGDLENALIAATPGGIGRQEAEGQRTLVASTMLPKVIHGATRERLTALGFKFGADVDDLFLECELPAGWTKVATDHSMHSDVLDEQGRCRASIFYKAAFYDRSAHMRMSRRFRVESCREGRSENTYNVAVTDCGKVIKDFGDVGQMEFAARDALERDANSWLTEQYPDWNSPLTYW